MIDLPSHQAIGLSPPLFHQVFPFHLAFDRQFTVRQFGKGLGKVCPSISGGSDVRELLRIVSPDVPYDFAAIREQSFSVFFLEYLVNGQIFKGQMLEAGRAGDPLMLFLCSPVVRDLASLKKLGLTLRDFAIHDPIADFLVLLQAKNNTIDDVRLLAERLQQEVAIRQDAEESLKVINAELEERVTCRTVELEKARNEAEAANRSKSEFLANMSHEIRTPMNAIIGLATLALANESNLKQRDYCRKILFSANALLGIINDILDYSKIEAGKLQLEHVPFDLGDILDHIIDLFGAMVSDKGIELFINLEEGIPTALVGDPLRLGQVLINLTSNAVKFTETGEIIIGVSMVRSDSTTAVLRFLVSDSGIGIPADKVGILFSSFTQVDGSTTRKYGGTGLGLAICKRLTEMMGGTITVESRPLVGSTFSFTSEFGLQQESLEDRAQFMAATTRDVRILVVDDNEVARRILRSTLESFRFSVQAVSSGREALEELRRGCQGGKPYGLVLLDWKMPDLDGMATLGLIQQNPELAGLPVIMVTAFGKEDVQNDACSLGARAIVTKPVKQSVLLDAIMEAFGFDSARKLVSPPGRDLTGGTSNRLRGGRILLVEDNAINQQVATEILQNAGLVVEVAVNGREAIAKAEGGDFDAVLMDVQMPEMDGYQATAVLRGNPRFSSLPIIAMTAHAMQGDREKCLAAGMDDYVSKPIDTRQLFTILCRWVSPRPVGMDMAPPSTLEPPAAVSQAEAIDGLDIEAGLRRLSGNRALYYKLLRQFEEGQAAILADIGRALASGDGAKLRLLVHTVKGVAGNISATRLHAAAQDLEKRLEGSQPKPGAEFVEAFRSAYTEVAAAIRLLPREEAADPVAGVQHGVRAEVPGERVAQVARLDALLQEGDLEAGEALEFTRELLTALGGAEVVDSLACQIGGYRFAEARKILAQIVSRIEH